MREYDLIAEWYAAERVDQTGVPEVAALASSIAPGSRVLDIGCGNGKPLTRAPARGIVEACPFLDRTFDAAVAWGVLFHLTPPHQVSAIASVSRIPKSGLLIRTAERDSRTAAQTSGSVNAICAITRPPYVR